MRASYNWISIWAPLWLLHYVFLYAVTLVGVARLRNALPFGLRFFALGLPLVGILSVPVSYLMLEQMKLGLTSQLQPMRALLFITVMAALLSGIAACVAVRENRYWEAMVWLILVYLIPANNRVLELPSLNRVVVVLVLAALAFAAIRADTRRRNWAAATLAAAALAAFFVIPIYGKVTNYPTLHSPELEELCAWARSETPKSSVFLFPDAGRDLYPGVFRAEALRAVYVDWKAGGQVNYFKDFGEQWWSRWQEVTAKPFTAADSIRFASEGIDFIVLKSGVELEGHTPAFENSRFAAYAIRHP